MYNRDELLALALTHAHVLGPKATIEHLTDFVTLGRADSIAEAFYDELAEYMSGVEELAVELPADAPPWCLS